MVITTKAAKGAKLAKKTQLLFAFCVILVSFVVQPLRQ